MTCSLKANLHKQRPSEQRRRAGSAWLAAAAGLTVLAAGTLFACVGLDHRTVHFHPEGVNFLRMPQPWIVQPREKRALTANRPEGVEYSDAEGVPDPRLARLERLARAAEEAGRVPEALQHWTNWQDLHTHGEDPAYVRWDRTPAPQYEKPSLPDRLAALRSWRGPGDTADLHAYLRARDQVDAGRNAETTLAGLQREPYRTHAEYLQASILYRTQPERAAEAYRRLLARVPPYAAARYMLGRIAFAAVVSTETEADDGTPDPPSPEARARLQGAARDYDACAALAPGTSLGLDAAGMAGACYFRLEDDPQALLRYCRQLATLKPGHENHDALLSARWCLRRMTLPQHEQFQKLALREPACAAIYLDLNLHFGRAGTKGLRRLGLFALEVMKQRPAAPLSTRVLTHLAVVEDRSGHYANAARLVQAALRGAPRGILRDQARWQHALILSHQKKTAPAIAAYEALSSNAVLPHTRRAAHEAAAVLSERSGDYPNALRHYFALDYQSDFGYVADCLASPDDLRAFTRRYPKHPRARLITYSLGIRQLRSGDYPGAIATFGSLGTWLQKAEKEDIRWTKSGASGWPPLKTAQYLLNCRRQESRARTDGEKARWAYAAARALFHQRHLVFYNGLLWESGRMRPFGWYGGPKNVEHPGAPLPPAEKRKYERYQEEHAALYQALQRFLQIAERYPRTPEAPKALYSAALCYTMLPEVENYWRGVGRESLLNRATACYRRLQRLYPNDPLAAAARKWGGPLPTREKPAG